MANVVFGTKTVSSRYATMSASSTLGHVTFNTTQQLIYYGTGTSALPMNGIPTLTFVAVSGKTSYATGSNPYTYYDYTVPGIVCGVTSITGTGGVVKKTAFACTPTITSTGISTKVRLTAYHTSSVTLMDVSGVIQYIPC